MECLQAQKKYPILRRHTRENLKHKVQNFKLEIQRQSVNGNLVKQNLDKGKKYGRYARLDGYLTNNCELDYGNEYETLDCVMQRST